MKYLSRRHNEAQDEFEVSAERGPLDRGQGRHDGRRGAARPPGGGLPARAHRSRSAWRSSSPISEVLVLRDVEDLSYEELGEITGLGGGHREKSAASSPIHAQGLGRA